MKQSDSIAHRTLPLRGGAGMMPALGFGTLIPEATVTRNATRTALETGFRHLDCSERYRNEEQVGVAIREAIQAGWLNRDELFVTTKLWNNNHRRERVQREVDERCHIAGIAAGQRGCTHVSSPCARFGWLA